MTSTESPATLVCCKFVASLAVTALMLACLSPAWAQNPPVAPPQSPEATSGPPLFEHWKINLDVGARYFDLSGDQPGMFVEHRDITRGFFVNNAGLHFESAKSPFSFRLNASEVRELDETIAASLSKAGKLRTTFLWDRLPRYYSTGTSLFHAAAPGNLIVSPAIRAGFQALIDGQTPQPPTNISPALAPFARAELAAGTVSALRIQRDQAGLRQTGKIGRVELHVQAKSTLYRGNLPKGTGTFARQNNGAPPPTSGQPKLGPPNDGVWESLGTEFPEPTEYRTTDFKAGAVVSGVKWRFGLDYRFTLFRNNVGTLTFQNPFRATDKVGETNPGANCPGFPPNSPGVIMPCPGSGRGRYRAVSQQLSLPPDTDYHSVTGWWGFDLPQKTQFRGLVSWGVSSQNDPFLAYTLNTALNGTGPGFANNIPSGTSVTSVAALPQRSLNGQVRSINVDSSLVSKLWKNMVFRLQYRNEDMKNKSPSIAFPGYSRFGDSHWVTAVDYYGVPIQNFPVSFTRQDGIASWEWDIASWVTWNAEYQYETWKRTNRDVPHSAENSFEARLGFKLPRKAKFTADFTYSDRVPDFYRTAPIVFNPNLNSNLAYSAVGAFGPGWEIPSTGCTSSSSSCTAAVVFDPTVPLEFSQLRRFDEAARRRYDGKTSLDVPLTTRVNFSASYRYLRDNYGKGFYGMHFDDQTSVDGELTFSVGERTFLYMDYSRQFDSYRYLSLGNLICGPSCVNGAPPNVASCCAVYAKANSWDRTSRSTLDTAQFGFDWAPSGEKTTVDMSYGYSFAKDQIHTFNPFPPILAISPLTAGTYDYPDTRNRFQEVLFSVTRKLRPGLDLGVQYRFESYLLDDFFLNNLQPYSQGLIAPGGVLANLPRQTFLNARFTTYHAHEESFFVRYSF